MNCIKNYSVKVLLIAVAMMLSLSALAQTKISGTVTGEDGQPIPGVSVLVKGTSNGTVTDIDGKYTVNAPADATLEFSFVGYSTKEIAVAGKTTINAVLAEDVALLEETLVVGYAVGNKRSVTGAVEKISAEDMNQGFVTTATDAIRGKVPGLVITQNGGNVTDTPTIRLRGTTSLSGGNDPLVIIDGVFGDIRMLNSLSPEEIKDITVLKDASETAQYGSRGAAGVLVVTTQKGQKGQAKVEYNGQFGVAQATRTIDVLNAGQFRQVCADRGYGINDFKNPDNSFDWVDYTIRKASIQQSHNLAFSQGSDHGSTRASIGFRQRQGVIRNSDNTNYNMRFATTQKALDGKLVFDLNLMASYTKQNIVDPYIIRLATMVNPTFLDHRRTQAEYDRDLKGEVGMWDYNASNGHATPGEKLEDSNKRDMAMAVASGRITYNIIDGLSLSAFGSYNYFNSLQREYYPNDTHDYKSVRGQAEVATSVYQNVLGSLQLNFEKTVGKSYFNALALAEFQKYTSWYDWSRAQGFDTNYFGYNNLKAGAIVNWGSVESNASTYSLNSYMVRFNYMYGDRYVVTVNARADGSSKLGASNKWGFFPSASAAWILTNEKWMKSQKTLSNLKIRVGYGVTGNQDAISPYNSLKLMTPNQVTSYQGASTVAYTLNSNANADLKWETKYTFDAGIDFGFWNNRMSGTLDVYKSTTKDLLYNYTVPVPPFAYTTLLANMGEMTNDGIEFALRGAVVETKDWEFSMGANVAWQKNKLVSLSGTYDGQELTTAKYIALASYGAGYAMSNNNNVVYMTEGQPVGIFRMPVCTGFKTMKNGYNAYDCIDRDDNSAISYDDSSEDRVNLGQTVPKVIAGFNAYLRFKDFDLSTQLNGAFGHMIYNGIGMGTAASGPDNMPSYNTAVSTLDLKIGDLANTSYWLEKGDYVNIEYITLGYNLPSKKLGLKKFGMRVALSCNNVYTFTKYSGLTPMINSSAVGGGVDESVMPVVRTWTLQLNLKF